MNWLLLAQSGYLSSMGILGWIIAIIILAGAVAILVVILNRFGIKVPDWIIQILWILFAVVVGVVAIRFLWTLW